MSDLYPGEQIWQAAGFPALVRYVPGDAGRPLIVFVPGAAHLGRIAYGFPGGRDDDFLAHWLARAGYPVLAVSYPIDQTCYGGALYPAYAIQDWAAQAMAAAARCVAEHGLSSKVIVLGWSVAGSVYPAIAPAATALGLTVELYVSLVATPGLPLLIPGLASLLAYAPTGLADVSATFYPVFEQMLDVQNQLAGHTIIPLDVYTGQFLGDFPVALTASGLQYAAGQPAFVTDVAATIADTNIFAYAFPPAAAITDTSALDDRHALTDRGNWAFLAVEALYRNVIDPASASLPDLPAERWDRVRALVNDAPARLSTTIPGTHFFFVGEPGARQTADAILALHRESTRLNDELTALLAKAS